MPGLNNATILFSYLTSRNDKCDKRNDQLEAFALGCYKYYMVNPVDNQHETYVHAKHAITTKAIFHGC
jgi:hypothetical protein